ncbi:hypothetical protein Dimus_030679, partial [Dionaea muscipula]
GLVTAVAFVESINQNVVVVLENGLSNSLTRFTRRHIREQQAASVSPPCAQRHQADGSSSSC